MSEIQIGKMTVILQDVGAQMKEAFRILYQANLTQTATGVMQ
jgi:hypothetical protein